MSEVRLLGLLILSTSALLVAPTSFGQSPLHTQSKTPPTAKVNTAGTARPSPDPMFNFYCSSTTGRNFLAVLKSAKAARLEDGRAYSRSELDSLLETHASQFKLGSIKTATFNTVGTAKSIRLELIDGRKAKIAFPNEKISEVNITSDSGPQIERKKFCVAGITTAPAPVKVAAPSPPPPGPSKVHQIVSSIGGFLASLKPKARPVVPTVTCTCKFDYTVMGQRETQTASVVCPNAADHCRGSFAAGLSQMAGASVTCGRRNRQEVWGHLIYNISWTDQPVCNKH